MKEKDIILAAATKASLFNFVQVHWGTIIKEDPVWNWHIPYLCRVLQDVVERAALGLPKAYDVLINIPPGETKSTLAVQMVPAWAWTRWPWMRFIAGSYSGELAIEHGGYTKDIVTSELYKRLYPFVSIRKDQDGRGNFRLVGWRNEHNQLQGGGQRMTASVEGTITGKHAHVVLVDDPINPRQAISETKLKSANAWMDSTLSTRKVDKAITPTILIMQRLHEVDPSGHWINQKGDRLFHICLPGECRNYEVKPPELKAYYVDDLLDPTRLPWSVLEEMKLTLGEYSYAGQFGQDPAPPEGGMFKVKEIEQRIVDMPPAKIKKVVRYWDKAGTEGAGAFTAGAEIAEMDSGDYIILDMVRGQWGPDKREAKIRETAEADGTRVRIYLEQEPGSGGKDSVHFSLRGLAGFPAYADRPTGDKVYRADPLAAQVNAGHVYMMKGDWNRALIDEMRLFPNGKYKDQVDALSGGFARLTDKQKRAGALRTRKASITTRR